MEPRINGLAVEEWRVDRPIAYAQNPRTVTTAAIDKVAASLKEFGWRQPIVVDKENVIVVGHTRLLAARKLGLLTVPVHIARDLTPSQARAYRIADNRTGEETKWAPDLLELEMADLATEPGMQLATGFAPGDQVLAGDQLLDPYGEDSGSELGMAAAFRWGRKRVRIMAEEAALLDAAYALHMASTGGSGGFARVLTTGKAKAHGGI